EGLLLAALADPDHLAALVVPDDGQVLRLAAAVADLVDANLAQPSPEPLAGRLLHPARDQPLHRRPVHAELAAHAGDRRVARSLEHLQLERVGESRTRTRPRPPFGAHAAPAAADAPERRDHHRRDAPRVQVSPPTRLALRVVASPFGLAAPRAHRR